MRMEPPSLPMRTPISICLSPRESRIEISTSLPRHPPAVPTETFSSEKTMKLNRSTLQLKYYGPAHTDSDISVVISEADIFHCADTYWNGFHPFIDYATGGNIDGIITEANVAT